MNLFVQSDDTAGQTTLAGYIGGDGIQEEYVQDRRLSKREAAAHGLAVLAQRASLFTTVAYTVHDNNARTGRTQSVNLASPTSVTGSFLIQDVTVTDFQLNPATVALTAIPEMFPRRQVTASTMRFSFEDLLRKIKDIT